MVDRNNPDYHVGRGRIVENDAGDALLICSKGHLVASVDHINWVGSKEEASWQEMINNGEVECIGKVDRSVYAPFEIQANLEQIQKEVAQRNMLVKALEELQRGIYDFADASLEVKNYVYRITTDALKKVRDK